MRESAVRLLFLLEKLLKAPPDKTRTCTTYYLQSLSLLLIHRNIYHPRDITIALYKNAIIYFTFFEKIKIKIIIIICASSAV